MSEERERRLFQNETLYRQVNLQIEELREEFAEVTPGGDFTIVCECGQITCTQQLAIPRTVYQRTRDYPLRFILTPGHERQDLEQTIEESRDYLIVEKRHGYFTATRT